jgi:hypothetical protein
MNIENEWIWTNLKNNAQNFLHIKIVILKIKLSDHI